MPTPWGKKSCWLGYLAPEHLHWVIIPSMQEDLMFDASLGNLVSEPQKGLGM